MPLRKTREQREAQRAEIDRQDREHAGTRRQALSRARELGLLEG